MKLPQRLLPQLVTRPAAKRRLARSLSISPLNSSLAPSPSKGTTLSKSVFSLKSQEKRRSRLKQSQSTSSLGQATPLRTRLITNDNRLRNPLRTLGQCLQWKSGEVLGQGSEGAVRKAFNIATGALFAVKQLFTCPPEGAVAVVQEVQVLTGLQHPNVIQYFGSEVVNNVCCIYLEYLSGGSIKSLIQKIGPLPEDTAKQYINQALAGLVYLHRKGIIHRDVKGANLLLDSDGRLKLSDFGSSKKYLSQTESGLVTTIKGSLAWTAPEVLLKTGYGRRSDIWSLGCTVLEMLTGLPPWKGCDDYIALLVKLAKSQELPEIPDTISPVAQDFILKCLQRRYRQRPTAKELLTHDFLKL